MKIRITGKRLPKAQMWNSQIGFPSMDWNKLNSQPRMGMPSMTGISPEEETMRPDNQNYSSQFGSLNTGIGPQSSQKEQEMQRAYQGNPEVARNYDFGVGRAMLSNYMNPNNITSKKEMLGYTKFLNNKYSKKEESPADFQDFAQGMQNFGNAMKLGVGVGSMVTGKIAQDKREKEFNQYKRNQMNSDALFNPVSGSRGDYVVTGSRFGEFRPDDYVVNRGMFAEQGGEYTEPMRIRITGTPNMEYGGQSNYGLDLGRRNVYADMPDSRSEMFNSTIGAVPREEANIEAEGGETVYGDLNGDGGNEHMKITGPRHSQGGVPLNVPEGSFIFSDTKKMRIKDPQILKYFGVSPSKGGVTPAKIAKRYDLNKYKAVMEDDAQDELNKTTAQLMMNNYEDKLAKLSMVQESMKGFPQGIPQVAEGYMDPAEAAYGGYILPKAQDGRNFKNTQEIANYYKSYGYTGKPNIGELQRWMVQKAKSDPTFGKELSKYLRSVDLTNKGKKAYGKDANKANLTDEQLYEQFNDNLWGYRFPKVSPQQQTGINGKFKCTPNGVVSVRADGPMASMQPGLFNSYEEALAVCGKSKPAPAKEDPVNPNQVGAVNNQDSPFGYLTPDIVNFAAAALVPPKKYMPYRSPVNLPRVSPTFYDPNREIAAQNETANIMAQNAATFGNPQAYMANASRLQGSLAEGVANTMGRTQNQNVQVANQFAGVNADIIGKENMLNAQRVNELYDANTMANQQFDNSRRLYNRNLAGSYATAWNNRMNMGLLNTTNPMYKINPVTGKSYFTEGYGSEDLSGNNTNMGGVNWSGLYKNFAQAQQGFPLITPELFLRYANPRSTQTDTNGDGVTDRTTKQTGKRGGQVSRILDRRFR